MPSALSRSIARGFRYMDDTVRGDASGVTVEFMPADRRSLSEMGSAASQVSGTLTWEQTQSVVWQQTPAQIRIAKLQRVEDAAVTAAAAQAAAPPPPPPPADPAAAVAGVPDALIKTMMPDGKPSPTMMRGRRVPPAVA